MSGKLTRRTFLRGAVRAGVSPGLLPRGIAGCGDGGAGVDRGSGDRGAQPLLFVSIDSLPPALLYLDGKGRPGGSPGDWLMPNVRAFLESGTWFEDARDYLPAATDMNHLNAIAGTHSGLTGIVSVAAQPTGWNPDGTADLRSPHMSWALDDRGRRVDTLFNAWKRTWPDSRTLFSSGKFWVADMYRDGFTDVDVFLAGNDHPYYVPPPEPWPFHDPEGDADADVDAESWMQRLYIEQVLMRDPVHFPCDRWLVDATLQVLETERPDFGVVILAQMDDIQHALGTVTRPEEFEPCLTRCHQRSGRNLWIYKEPILDAVRDVDVQFGRLMDGLAGMPAYRDATVVLYSDHGHTNHLLQRVWHPGDRRNASTDLPGILRDAGCLSVRESRGHGFACVSGSCVGLVYWQDDADERERRAREAKEILVDHVAENPETGNRECPWDLLVREDMIRGLPGVAGPGELWHPHYGAADGGAGLPWPDLIVFMRNGWQMPVYGDVIGNLGIDLPFPLPPAMLLLGGHGAPDTQRIVMAMRGPGISAGRVLADPGHEKDYRISDLAVTVAGRLGLELRTTTVGRDRSAELSVASHDPAAPA